MHVCTRLSSFPFLILASCFSKTIRENQLCAQSVDFTDGLLSLKMSGSLVSLSLGTHRAPHRSAGS